MSCSFERDKFLVGENAIMLLSLDNSECLSDVNGITCKLIQKTTIASDTTNFTEQKVLELAKVELPGVPKGEHKTGNNAMIVTLPIKTGN
jgi:hypothetical protein